MNNAFMNKSLISVIVPVFNVEKYVNKCLDSIINQDFYYLNIIVVDDGSFDDCSHICDSYILKDNRIIVIHKKNEGVSSSRNCGIVLSSGEHICFIDSDDFIEPSMISALYTASMENNSDVSECDYNCHADYNNGSKNIKEIVNYTKEEALLGNIKDEIFKQIVWNKLYKSSILIDEPFPVEKNNEDEFWTYKILAKANTLCRISLDLYHYVQRNDSYINSSYSLKRLDIVDAKKEKMFFINDNFPTLYDYALKSFLSTCRYEYQCISRNIHLDIDGFYRKRLYDSYRNYFSIGLISDYKFENKLWCIIFTLFPNLYSLIRNLFRIGL